MLVFDMHKRSGHAYVSSPPTVRPIHAITHVRAIIRQALCDNSIVAFLDDERRARLNATPLRTTDSTRSTNTFFPVPRLPTDVIHHCSISRVPGTRSDPLGLAVKITSRVFHRTRSYLRPTCAFRKPGIRRGHIGQGQYRISLLSPASQQRSGKRRDRYHRPDRTQIRNNLPFE